MSSSGESRGFSCRKKLPEKPSFSQTCSRLSRYLKEKGSFGDLSLGMTCNPDVSGVFGMSRQPTVMNLFPCEEASAAKDVKPKNMVSRQSSFSSSSSSGAKEDVEKLMETKSVKVESQSCAPPLTIFYGGQILVFDDFPAEKAKQVIDLANHTAYTQNIPKNQKEIASPTPNPVPSPAKTAAAPEPIKTNTSSLACELPIARRASLHRFLEKRKDRITSKAPYQIDGSTEASSKPNTSWLGPQ